MDELDLSKRLQQTEEQYHQMIVNYQHTLEATIQQKEKEIAIAQENWRNSETKLHNMALELEAIKAQLNIKEASLAQMKLHASRTRIAMRLQSFLSSLLFLLATVLASFGVNLLASNIPNPLGFSLIALASLTYVIATVVNLLLVNKD